MKSPVLVFQKFTLTLDQLRSQAKRIPGRTIDLTKSVKEQDHQRQTTQDMMLSELTAIGAAIQLMQTQTEKDQSDNNQAVQRYKETIRKEGHGLASNLDEIQTELDVLAGNMRQNLRSQSEEMQQFDQIDVQSDQQRILNISKYSNALEISSDITGYTCDHMKVGQQSLEMELKTEQVLNKQAARGLARAANQEAIRLISEGCLAASIEELQQAIRLDPENADLRFNLVRALAERGELVAAQENFDVATKLAPNSPRVLQVGGWVALCQGKFDEAISRFNEALKGEWSILNKLELLEGLAQAEYQVGRPDHALEAWTQVLEIDPYHPTARLAVEWIR
jgi:tetratricopeptide (TPR) repeat protein